MDENCIFCKIIKGKLPAKFIIKKKNYLAFHDINPKAPVHALVIPLVHFDSLSDARDKDKEMMGELLLGAREAAKELGILDKGYKIVINNGKAAGQIVFHLHLHILGGWKKISHWQV